METTSVLLTDHASTERNQRKSPLLRLPAKLRNKIYIFALDTAAVNVRWDQHSILTRDDLHLPRACRQIHTEVQPFLDTYTILRLT